MRSAKARESGLGICEGTGTARRCVLNFLMFKAHVGLGQTRISEFAFQAIQGSRRFFEFGVFANQIRFDRIQAI